jgi:hypothetical protein
MTYHRCKLLDFGEFVDETDGDDTSNDYHPFHLDRPQLYNPIYSLFFKMDDAYLLPSISLNHRYAMIRQNTVMDQVTHVELEKPIFTKFSPLLDPNRYLTGFYKLTDPSLRVLPNTMNASECHPKLADTNNVSYIDSFFSYLSSQLLHHHNVLHGIDFYGSFLAIQNVFKINVADDFDYLNGSSFFLNHIGDEFSVSSPMYDDFANYGSRKNKQRIQISNNQTESSRISLGAEDLNESEEGGDADTEEPITEMVYEKQGGHSESHSLYSRDDDDEDDNDEEDSEDEDLNYSSDEDLAADADADADPEMPSSVPPVDPSASQSSGSESIWTDDSTESEDVPIYAYIKNYPIQMICLEKCEGTLDELFEKGLIDEDCGSAFLMQIIMTLLVYQKAFRMTHNDLHTNNIMYVSTPFEYVYYCYESKYYRVPTHGKLMKIIDFGRSIYKYRGKLFCSDSFAPGGDADTQYNSEPYFNETKARVDPNPSFDLCRLGCSIYDFVINEEGEAHPETLDDFQKTIVRWCLDDNRKNMLYKKNGDERYPNFKLYKMIARNVHKHTPQAQLKYPLFKKFEIPRDKLSTTISSMNIIQQQGINLDEIPDYT